MSRFAISSPDPFPLDPFPPTPSLFDLDELRQLLSDRDVAAIAADLDITEQSVYKNIRDGGLDAIMHLIHALTGRLNRALNTAN